MEVALGNALERAIQRWVSITGRRVRTAEAPWLENPVGGARIGARFYEDYAREARLQVVRDDPDAGLLPDFGALAGEDFSPEKVHPEVRRFYERTASYDLTVRARWHGPFKHPPRTLIYLVGRNIGQFNIPLSRAVTQTEMENELISLTGPVTGEPRYVGWLRRSAATREVMLAGLYSTCGLPGMGGRFFKGVYPLPGGSSTTIFRPENRPDGSFVLVSDGRRFGEPGYYRVHRTGDDDLRAKSIPMEEAIHVFLDPEHALRARHTFAFGKLRFLDLHYEITPREPHAGAW